MKVVQISDTHLSHLGGVPSENFEKLVEFVNEVIRPDFVVNSGDIVILSPDSAEDREAARKLHQGFDAPLLIVPGNHDLGMPGDHPWMGIGVTSERVAGYLDTFGSDHFVEFPDDAWAIVGMNSEILSSGLPEEELQWTWLAGVAERCAGRSILLFLHRPFWSPFPEYTEHALAIEEADRNRLLELFSRSTLKAVASGHLHRYISAYQDDILTVSAPSSAFVEKSLGSRTGLNQLGVVEYRTQGSEIEAYFRSVPTLTEESPYGMPAFVKTMAMIEASVTA
jgi:3',5'-cyclic AMP phosphodiesterase CpdA